MQTDFYLLNLKITKF